MKFTVPAVVHVKATRFTLFELWLLITCSAVACFFSTREGLGVGASFLITVVAFRTAVVDFTLVGGLATLLTMFFGMITLVSMVIWSIAW